MSNPIRPRLVLLIALLASLILACTAFATMVVWNNTLPHLFNAPTLTFWDAFGLIVLSHLLFPRTWNMTNRE